MKEADVCLKEPLSSSSGESSTDEKKPEIEIDEKMFYFDMHETPPIHMTFFFAMQVLMSLSRSLSTSLLVAEVVCARTNEVFKARLLSTTMFMSGMCTLLQNTIGVRLPLYQGPAAMYVIPLIALSTLPEWRCDVTAEQNGPMNISENASMQIQGQEHSEYLNKVHRLEGSLMIAGAIHFLIGATGLVGFLMRFIGPVTVIPALTVISLYVHRVTVKFAKSQWGVCMFTVAVAVIFSFYLRGRQTPLPYWSRRRGFHIKFYPLHKMFSVLLACLLGWLLSAILTVSGVLSSDPNDAAFYARTDSRLFVVKETNWFIFPYPGQFGSPLFDTGAFVTFIMGTIASVIDSIGDYYACANVCDVPPPPTHAVNRGIAVEGMLSLFAGWAGAGHATSTFGGNIGAIGISKVASLRVFQCVGLIFIVFGVVGKIGAVFVTIPYSVVGGMMMINFGVLTGVMLANMQFIDMSSTRNLAIIGLSMLIGFMCPHWLQTTPNAINTGNGTLDGTIKMFLANPGFVAGFLGCFLDNTVPGTRKERGMVAWQAEFSTDETTDAEAGKDEKEQERLKHVRKCVYVIPYLDKVSKKIPFFHWLPCCPARSKQL